MTTKAKPIQIELDSLREALSYDPETGVFTWLIRTSSRVRIGQIAGRVDPQGYRRIKLYGVEYLAHRLAWLHMTGGDVPPEIDHKDRDPSNNAFSNLRPATRSQNVSNSRLRAGKTLPKGVTRHIGSKRFIAQIVHKGVTCYLGTFDTPQEAHSRYMIAAAGCHGEFARAV